MNSKQHLILAVAVATCLATGLVGCDNADAPRTSGANGTKTGGTGKNVAAAALPASTFLTEAPSGAVPVSKLKASAKEGDEVTVRVVVGGRMKPFVADRAIMTVVDAGLANECVGPDAPCKTPWDYCCSAPEQLKPNLATVQIVDATGATMKVDLNASAKLKPAATVVVRGVVGPRPDPSALVINATGIFVETK
ncbi:MAG: hypothetical protein OER86_00300 [Phycisphaerae bacterium]|nr:hypothetical protein [Phycisphaerae bacterium]